MSDQGKKLIKLEAVNNSQLQELRARDQLINELKEELRHQGDRFREGRLQGHQPEDLEQIAAGLMDENNELKEQINNLQEVFDNKKTKYKLRIEQLENDLIDMNKYYEQPDKRVSVKRKADFIKLENELRQKNLYIDSLLDKIKELQSLSRDNQSNNRTQLSSKNNTRNSIDVSRISANK